MVCSRTWYIYQHFLFDFPFDEIFRRLLFSLSGVCTRYVYTYDTYVMFQIRMYLVSACRNLYVRTLCSARGRTRLTWGPTRPVRGLLSFCLSRAKRLVDLMVEPMSFDRIGNLGNSSTMNARLQEEVRLVELATEHEGKVHGHGRLQRRRG